MPSLRKKVLMFVSTTGAMSVRAWSFFPPSTRAQPSGQWRRKAYAPRRASSTAGSRQPMPLSGTSRRKSLSCSIGLPKQKRRLPSRRHPDLVSLLNAYYTQRRAGAYSQKGKISNLKEMNETFNYLRRNGIYSLEDLELPGQLSSGGVELYQFRFMLCLVLGSGLPRRQGGYEKMCIRDRT